MKKILMLFGCLFTIMSVSMPVNAQDISQKVGAGYTPDGVYYEVFIAEDLENDISLLGNSLNVTREVRYYGIVKPLTEISWTEEISGVYYSGVLQLVKFAYSSTETIATYKGVLYEE